MIHAGISIQSYPIAVPQHKTKHAQGRATDPRKSSPGSIPLSYSPRLLLFRPRALRGLHDLRCVLHVRGGHDDHHGRVHDHGGVRARLAVAAFVSTCSQQPGSEEGRRVEEGEEEVRIVRVQLGTPRACTTPQPTPSAMVSVRSASAQIPLEWQKEQRERKRGMPAEKPDQVPPARCHPRAPTPTLVGAAAAALIAAVASAAAF